MMNDKELIKIETIRYSPGEFSAYVGGTFFPGQNSGFSLQKAAYTKIHIIFNNNVYIIEKYISLHNCLM